MQPKPRCSPRLSLLLLTGLTKLPTYEAELIYDQESFHVVHVAHRKRQHCCARQLGVSGGHERILSIYDCEESSRCLLI
jgi:hypothetical protein